jgi:hypothetical protein
MMIFILNINGGTSKFVDILKTMVYGDLPSPLKIREKWSAFCCLGLMSFKAQLSILTRSILDFIKKFFLIYFLCSYHSMLIFLLRQF